MLIANIRNGIHHAVNPGKTFIQNAPEIYKKLLMQDKNLVYRALAHLIVIRIATYLPFKTKNVDEHQRNVNTISAINNYFDWVGELPGGVQTFINSFYQIYFGTISNTQWYATEYNAYSKDGTSGSLINGKLKIAKEGQLCVQTLSCYLTNTIKNYKDFFNFDITDKEYRDILEKNMRDIIKTKKLHLDEKYITSTREENMIFEASKKQ